MAKDVPNHSHKPDISKANCCPSLPANASTLDAIVYWLGIGLGSGLPRRASGTWGTVGGLIIAMPLMSWGFLPFLVITLIASVVGIYICGRTSKLMNVHDNPHIVWDEWVGMWITLLPFSYLGIAPDMLWNRGDGPIVFIFVIIGSFASFRFFDIVKPFPINWLDKKVSGGFGIMIDDIVAGVMPYIIWYTLLIIMSSMFPTS